MRRLPFIALLLVALILSACKSTEPFAAYKGANAKEIFDRAEANLGRRHYEAAVKDFEALDTLYPFGDYSQQGQLDIIYAYYKKGDVESALAATDRYIRMYPRAANVDYAYYMKGLINMGPADSWLEHWTKTSPSQRDLSNLDEAFQNFNLLIERFPNSAYAADARNRMVYIRNILAQRQLELAQYYLERKVYVAAANRASNVVLHYQGAPQVLPALAIMVKSYRALGEDAMANNALQVLTTSYPNSKETKQFLKK